MFASPSFLPTLTLFVFMGVGFAAGRLRYLSEETCGGLSKFLAAFILPALILDSMQQPVTAAVRAESWLALGISFGSYGLAFLLAFPFVRLIGARGGEAGASVFGAVFSNMVFMGFPIMEALLGRESLLLASICTIPFQILAFSVGPYILARSAGRKVSLGLRSFINPAGVTSLLGFGLFLLGIYLPRPLLHAASLLGSVTTPLSMALIGAILSRMSLSSLVGRPRILLVSLFRLVLFPALLYVLLRVVGVSGLLLAVPVVVAAMPVAANSAILAEAYGGDAEAASALVLVTTLLSLLTIPALGTLLRGIL